MSRADDADDEMPEERKLPTGFKNYITPAGFRRMQDELRYLLREERPKVVDVVAWAASLGDRSENADYLYGKKRLREIDRRIRFLTRRIEIAHVVDPVLQKNREQAFFGSTVTYENARGEEKTVTIVGVDEIDPDRNRISWISPVARALLKSREGDIIQLRTPAGIEELEVIAIRYPGSAD